MKHQTIYIRKMEGNTSVLDMLVLQCVPYAQF